MKPLDKLSNFIDRVLDQQIERIVYWMNNHNHATGAGASIVTGGTYANNAAAVAAGLPVGTIYRTSTGSVMVVY